MSIVKADPNSRQIERPGFDWEREKTLVEQQKSFGARLRRFFTVGRIFWIAILLIILLNEDIALFVRGFVDQLATSFLQFFAFDLSQSGQLLVRLVFGITIAIGQFALIFWFLGRARMYTIWPGGASEGVGFKDYRGQPELLDQAKQIVTLLRGVRVFEESGGEPLTGGRAVDWTSARRPTRHGQNLDGSSDQYGSRGTLFLPGCFLASIHVHGHCAVESIRPLQQSAQSC